MEGVTILDQFVVESGPISPWSKISRSLCVLGFLGVVIFGIIAASEGRSLISLILAALCFFASVCIGIFGPQVNEAYYQVTISDEVNFNEFNERYEIIEQNDLIYTVREREPK